MKEETEKGIMNKKLGKISNAKFGRVYDKEFIFGLLLDFGGDGWGISATSHAINMCEDCKWKNPEQRFEAIEKIMTFTYDLLEEAGVHSVNELIGIPVEVEFEDGEWGTKFKEFRILKEVL